MKFYANLYPVTIFYTNLPKIMLSLKFYAFLFYAVWEACTTSITTTTTILTVTQSPTNPFLQHQSAIKLTSIVSHRIVSYHIVSYRIVSHCIASYRIASYCIASYPILSYRIVLYRIVSYPIYRIVSHRIVSYRILSYPILSYCIASYPILSYRIVYHTSAIKNCRIKIFLQGIEGKKISNITRM